MTLDFVPVCANRISTTVKHVRQALALGRMAPAIRDAWRNGTINAETAEAFTLTTDHKAQAAAFRKVGKHASEYQVRQILAGGHDHNMPAMLAFVGKTAYEKAGYEVNQSLFLDEDNRRSETVSDIAALKRMTDEKIQTECDALVAEGWKWAVQRSDVPYDFYAWKRIFPDGGRFTKEQMSGLGCVLEIQHDGKVQVVRGYVKPGDKIALPKSPKQKKAEAKAREQHKEETGGISNALAFRLSKQLTEAVRQALSKVTNQSAVPIAIAMLASGSGPSKIRLGTEKDGDRHGNDFVKYLHLAMKKSQSEAYQLLAMWVAQSVDLTAHRSEHLACALHPGKENDLGTLALVEALPKLEFETEMLEQFDAADYFASVGKELIVQAVRETMGKEHADKVAKMKASEARDFAAKNIKGWVPPQLRLK